MSFRSMREDGRYKLNECILGGNSTFTPCVTAYRPADKKSCVRMPVGKKGGITGWGRGMGH